MSEDHHHERNSTPRPYPDYPKLIKRVGLSTIGYLLVGIALIIAARLILGHHHWVAVAATASFVVGFVAVLAWAGGSWMRDDLRRQRDLKVARAGLVADGGHKPAGEHPHSPVVDVGPAPGAPGRYAGSLTRLSSGERVSIGVWMALSLVLPSGSVLLVIFGRGALRTVGIVLLFVALIMMAVPISPVLKARIRRRERDG